MYDVLAVVNWLRVKNDQDLQWNLNAERITLMRTMKVLYYIQAASLVVYDHRFFNNVITKWKYSPMIRKVQREYKGQDFPGTLTVEDLHDYNALEADSKASDLLNSIYRVYGNSSAFDLMKQIESEDPWQEAEEGKAISDESLKKYYSNVFSVVDEK